MLNRVCIAVGVAALSVLVGACSDGPDTPQQAAAAPAAASPVPAAPAPAPPLVVEMRITPSDGYTVQGVTNLPEGTRVSVLVKKHYLPDAAQRLAAGLPACGHDCFPFQGETTVHNGSFVATPFQGRADLPSAGYFKFTIFAYPYPNGGGGDLQGPLAVEPVKGLKNVEYDGVLSVNDDGKVALVEECAGGAQNGCGVATAS